MTVFMLERRLWNLLYEVECIVALVYFTKHLQQTCLQLLYFNKGVNVMCQM